ncbi:hypothetical protein BJ508DRAFT_165547 [Ascobolus immersus RN42]|uniref:ARM repeat-containing protein n=1 Tax=Ascobolus immersus RN42 TaxID=1160509 RepID=A0A3N4HWX5_ASCIM|nr:hypothetical protein BJ508DRAFT_165547 [Ascobolus immersus RN42]
MPLLPALSVSMEDFVTKNMEEVKQILGQPEIKDKETLQPVVDALEYLKFSGHAADILDLVAVAARNESNRPVLGENLLDKIIDSVHHLLDSEGEIDASSAKVLIQAMRAIANCVADCDENRKRVLEKDGRLYTFTGVITQAVEGKLPKDIFLFVLTAFSNFLQTYEPSQKAAVEFGAPTVLLKILNLSPSEETQVLEYSDATVLTLRILEILFEKDEGPKSVDASAILRIAQLILTPKEPEFETYQSLLACFSALLKSKDIQTYLVANKKVSVVAKVMEHIYATFPPIYVDPAPGSREAEVGKKVLDTESDLLKVIFNDIGNKLCDVSEALGSLGTLSDDKMDSFFIGIMRSWLGRDLIGGYENELDKYVSFAAYSLGNIARSNEVANAMVADWKIQVELSSLLSSERVDLSTMFACTGLLKNLAILDSNKIPIASEPLLWVGIRRMLKANEGLVKDVPYSATSLVRLLTTNCPTNVALLFLPADAPEITKSEDFDYDEPAEPFPAVACEGPDSATSGSIPPPPKTKTNLSHLLYLHKKSDVLPIKTEIGRTLINILRSLSSDPQNPACKTLHTDRKRYLLHDYFLTPICERRGRGYCQACRGRGEEGGEEGGGTWKGGGG